MNVATALACAALLLVGCTSSGEATRSLTGPAGELETMSGAPDQDRRVLTVGTTPISPNRQTAFCQDEVAFTFKAEPQQVSTRGRVVAADGSTTIDVLIDNGYGGVRTYKCRLDASNRFIDVVASEAAI